MARLNAADRANLEQIMKSQLNETGWNFYNERQHVETLFYNRFNFFLMLYGMFVTAIVTLHSDLKCKIDSYVIMGLVFFAIIILSSVWATLCRNYQTLQSILCIIDNLPDYHSSSILSKCMGGSSIIRSRNLMALYIPFVCIGSLVVYWCYISDNFSCPFNYIAYLVLAIVIGCFFLFRHEIRKYNSDRSLDEMLGYIVSCANEIKNPCDDCVAKKYPFKQWIHNMCSKF